MTDVVNPCDVCGRPTAAADCVETIEEWLCAECASGISDDQDDDWDGCCEECLAAEYEDEDD